MSDRFARAFLAGEAVILGYRLPGYSVGHAFRLSAVGHPFAVGDGNLTPGDVVYALRVLASDTPRTDSFVPTLRDVWTRLRMTRDHSVFYAAAGAIVQFIEEHSSFPKFWKNKQSSGNGPTAPALLSLVASLVRFGVPEREAWAKSVGEAAWLRAALIEAEGGKVNFFDEERVSRSVVDPNEEHGTIEDYIARARSERRPNVATIFRRDNGGEN